MEMFAKDILYAAKCGEKYVGVFSSPAMALQCGYDVLDEITPAWIDGSPAPGRYVCMAMGTWSTLMQCDGAFKTEVVTIGPVWGANIQSALMQLLQPGFRSRGLEVTALQLFEIDRDLADHPPENIAHEYRFIIDRSSSEDRLTNGVISRDFIAQRIQKKQHDAQIAKVYDSRPMRLLMDRIMKANGRSRMAACAFAYSRQLERIRTHISRRFSMEEVQFLSALCDPTLAKGVAKRTADGAFPKAAFREMLDRFLRCLQLGGVKTAPFDRSQFL